MLEYDSFRPLKALTGVLLLTVSSAWGNTQIVPRLDLNLEFIDNRTNSLKESGTITRISPGIGIQSEGARASISIDYSLDSISSSGLRQEDQTNHRLSMLNTLVHIPGRWKSSLAGNISQANISNDGLQLVNPNLSSNNSSELRTLQFNTDFNGRVSDEIQFTSNLDANVADYEDRESTRGHGIGLGLDNFRTPRAFSWKAEIDRQVSEEEINSQTIDTGYLNLNYRFSQRFSTFIDASTTSSEFSQLDESNTLVGLFWTPSRYTSVRFGAGKRGSDKSYTLDASTRSRKISVSANYNETVTTARQTTLQIITIDSVFLGTVRSLSITPVLEKRATLSIAITGKRSNMSVSVFQTDRSQQILSQDEVTRGLNLALSRTLSARNSLSAGYLVQKSETTRENELTDVQISLNSTLSRNMTLVSSLRNTTQDSTESTLEYDQTSLSLLLSATF